MTSAPLGPKIAPNAGKSNFEAASINALAACCGVSNSLPVAAGAAGTAGLAEAGAVAAGVELAAFFSVACGAANSIHKQAQVSVSTRPARPDRLAKDDFILDLLWFMSVMGYRRRPPPPPPRLNPPPPPPPPRLKLPPPPPKLDDPRELLLRALDPL